MFFSLDFLFYSHCFVC